MWWVDLGNGGFFGFGGGGFGFGFGSDRIGLVWFVGWVFEVNGEDGCGCCSGWD